MKISFQKLVYNTTPLLAGFFFYFIFCFPLMAATFDRVVAKVNDDVITLGVLENEIAIFLSRSEASGSSDQPLQKKELMKQVLDNLVIQKLQLQEARKRGILIADETIQQALDDIYIKNNITSEEFNVLLTEEGSNLDSYKKIVRDQFLVSKVVSSQLGIVATPNEKAKRKFYKKNIKKFWIPAKVVLRHIFLVKDDVSTVKYLRSLRMDAEKILEEIKLGKSFSMLARKHSTDLTAHSGGLLGVVNRGTMMPEFEKVAFNLKIGEVSKVVETANGFHIIKCDSITPGHPKKYSLVRSEIQKILSSVKREQHYNKWVRELKKKSFIQVSLFDDSRTVKKNRKSNNRRFSKSSKSNTSIGNLKQNQRSSEADFLTEERVIEDKLRNYRKLFSSGKISKETFVKKKKELLESL
jgi:peptidyl-prolyl cis-trans isomerase SurA